MAQKHTEGEFRIAGRPIDPASVALLPYLFCVNNNVVVLGRVDPAAMDPIAIGTANPGDFQTLEIISRKFRDRRIEPVLISPTDVTKALSVGFQSARTFGGLRGRQVEPTEADMQEAASGDRYELELGGGGVTRVGGLEVAREETFSETAIIDMADNIMLDAVKRGATDIHVENFEESVNLRYKIDGMLYSVTSPLNKRNAEQFVSRLKVMSNLDIAERRLPQDGRVLFHATRGKKEIEIPFRLSILPGPFGEDVVLRVLDKSMAPIDLALLGFDESTLTDYRKMIRSPQGILLSTGPTGSGKTTTLYASLKEIQTPHNKILSAEDPIEYTLPGVCQKQVSKYFGFAELARAFLRHDPDILLIGEIRDEPTADIAIKAAQTGHLILSTLHTNDSFGVIPRLRSLGVDTSLIASALLGVLSQRLVRRICRYCREVYEPSEELLLLFNDFMGSREYVRGAGCPRCFGTGYHGRIGLFELLDVDQHMQWLILSEAPEKELVYAAVRHGMRLLVADAMNKVSGNVTTLEEIARVMPMRQIDSQLRIIRDVSRERSSSPTSDPGPPPPPLPGQLD